VLGIELLCAAQGLKYREPLRPGRGVERAYRLFRERVPVLTSDRILAPDIETAASMVREGAFADLWRT
jgi:histidine ammonia-lyase